MHTPGWGGLRGIQENQIQSMPKGQPGECEQDTHRHTHTDLVAGCTVSHRGTLGTGSHDRLPEGIGESRGQGSHQNLCLVYISRQLTFELVEPGEYLKLTSKGGLALISPHASE